MKKSIIFIATLCIFIFEIYAQNTPEGMRYQAAVRNATGELMVNESVQVRVKLGDASTDQRPDYAELHHVKTNALGLFSITIGAGEIESGKFQKIPWSKKQIWMDVEVQTHDMDAFKLLSHSQMLSVPYAFHAATAEKLVDQNINRSGKPTPDGEKNMYWELEGNRDIHPDRHQLGTLNEADLKIITWNKERIRIDANGRVNVLHDLFVDGNHRVEGEARIAKGIHVGEFANVYGDLNVDHDVSLNKVSGQTDVNGDLNVKNGRTTTLSGTLNVMNGSKSTFTGNVAVTEGSKTDLTGPLSVHDGAPTSLDGPLKVSGQYPTNLSGTLTVEGTKETDLGGPLTVNNQSLTTLTGDLEVFGKTSFGKGVDFNADAPDAIATFENRNGDTGDGIVIKLGKTHPRWNGDEVELVPPGMGILDGAVGATQNLFTNLLEDGLNFDENHFETFGLELLNIAEEQIFPQYEYLGAAACGLTNDIIGAINEEILPVSFPALTVPGRRLSDDFVIFGDGPDDDDEPDLFVPGVVLPPLSVTEAFTLIPELPTIDCPPLPDVNWSLNLPNVQFENVSNSLTSENKFIQFTDKDDRQLGAIEAQSIEEWGTSYLNVNYFLNVFNSFAGVTVVGLEPEQFAETAIKYVINGTAQFSNLIEDYNSIGVVYNSGFGDYAEWLQRKDPSEYISSGDIVGVVGGKISKDLTNAEQIMAVSTNPIVLGNAPDVSEASSGNKIAFMGQIPVKVMGTVQTGDFIVAKGNIPGYGVAVRPADMRIEDFEKTVGRSWEASPSEGPKMVNTVVGVHNGNMINVMKKMMENHTSMDARLEQIEAQLETIIPILKNNK